MAGTPMSGVQVFTPSSDSVPSPGHQHAPSSVNNKSGHDISSMMLVAHDTLAASRADIFLTKDHMALLGGMNLQEQMYVCIYCLLPIGVADIPKALLLIGYINSGNFRSELPGPGAAAHEYGTQTTLDWNDMRRRIRNARLTLLLCMLILQALIQIVRALTIGLALPLASRHRVLNVGGVSTSVRLFTQEFLRLQ